MLPQTSALSRPLLERRRSPFLAEQTRDGRPVPARGWKRIRILELLHEEWSLVDVAEAVGTYRREVRRVGWRFLERGVPAALTDDPRPKPPQTPRHAAGGGDCGDGLWPAPRRLRAVDHPPDHRGDEAPRDRADVGRETVRQVLAHHALKPWREKNVVRPDVGPEYIARMEDVLNVLARPYHTGEPVVALDERPVVLRGASRPGRPMAPGRVAREDYEYVRKGTANIYCIVEPRPAGT